MLQNLGLMTQALGLGGFSNYAAHPYIWFKTLGFRMNESTVSHNYGLGPLGKHLLRLLGKDVLIPTPVGLEKDGKVLLKPFCPPYYKTMEDAVMAFVDYKYGAGTGTLCKGAAATAWRDGEAVQDGIPRCSDEAIAATVAYSEYIYDRYGRFPAHLGPFRSVLGYQAHHLDIDFYDRFYQDDALTDTQRNHPDHQAPVG